MKKLELDGSDLYALVDDEDYPLLSRHTWLLHRGHNTRTNYVHTNINGTLLLHRLIMGNPEHVVGHLDDDGLNNQKANLKVLTDSDNKHSGPLRRDNKTGYKGVHFSERQQKYVAYIRKDGQRRHLGTFDDKHKAALAYNEAATILYGELAFQNEVHI